MSESDTVEKYCVEAKQWQGALQESRRLRGDAGPLSKFSIELLDDGYRAVDPALKIRFVVRPAPADTPLTDEADLPRASNGSIRPPVQSSAPAAFPSTQPQSVIPAAPVSPDLAPAKPGSIAPAKPGSIAPPRPAAKVAALSSQPARASLLVPADVVPKAPKLPEGLFPQIGPAADKPSAQPVSTPLGPVSLEVPESHVLRQRTEEPRSESPITYREIAYSVKPGVSRNAVEAVLWARFREVSEALADRSNGRFIQLAVFDHAFEKKPLRPPLATLAWKDWRGNPVLTFPGFDKHSKPPSSVPPKPVSIPPEAEASSPILLKQVKTPAADGVSPERPPAPAEAEVAEAPKAPEPAPAALAPAETAPAEAAVEAQPPAVAEPAPVAQPPAAAEVRDRPSRPSRPTLGRRRPGEDLISELFETTHELHFMVDVRAGAEFVLNLLRGVLPAEGVLVHVFDINTQNFVVVRAHGPHPERAILSRTPDKDPLFHEVMHRGTSIAFEAAGSDDRFASARWEALGTRPARAVCAPVKQGGRYLGLIELANLVGDAPVHETEINALDYICEQFAEFLANRPLVLDADVIIGKG